MPNDAVAMRNRFHSAALFRSVMSPPWTRNSMSERSTEARTRAKMPDRSSWLSEVNANDQAKESPRRRIANGAERSAVKSLEAHHVSLPDCVDARGASEHKTSRGRRWGRLGIAECLDVA